jgi:integrase/recombinase XerD
MIEQVERVRFSGEERHTYKSAVVKWAAEYLPRSVKAKTSDRYLVSVKALDAVFGDKYVDEIDRRTIAKFVSGRIKQHVTNATIRRDLSAVSSILKACLAWGWAETNPAKEYDRTVIAEKRDPIVLPTDEEVEAMISASPPMISRLWRLLVETGMREEEAAGLEWSQVSTKERRITLTRTKTNRPRVVPLDDSAVGTIAGTPVRLKCSWVFWHDDGERFAEVASAWSHIRQRVNKARTKEKLPKIRCRAHDLRHRYAVDYLRAGGNIYDLQKILGHSSIKTTELYLAYLTPEEVMQAKHGAGTKAGTATTV